jgi:hypothetical protein
MVPLHMGVECGLLGASDTKHELEAMPEQVTVPPAPEVLRGRPYFER